MNSTSIIFKRARVGIDAHVLDGKQQGSATFLAGLLSALAKLDPPFEVVVYSANPEVIAARIGPTPFTFSRLTQTNAVRRLLQTIPKKFADDQIDLGVFQYISPPIGSMKTLIVVHDVLPFTNPDLFPFSFRISRQLLFRHSIRRADAIATVSNTARTDILDLFDTSPETVFVMHNGPSFPISSYFLPTPTRPNAIPRTRPYILAVGRIEKRKNIDLLVGSFQRAGVSDVDLVIVGRADLGCQPKIRGIPNIFHLDSVDDSDLAAIHRNAALFAFPSRAEGFGIPMLDALLSGVPVIASNQTAIPEVASGLAHLFDPTADDAEDVLARLIRQHFTETPIVAPTEFERHALAAKFSWRAAAKVFIEAVLHVLDRNKVR